MTEPAKHTPTSTDDFDYCPNCCGEGVVYDCFSEYACIDPEGGCDMCARTCDWCRPRLHSQAKRIEQP